MRPFAIGSFLAAASIGITLFLTGIGDARKREFSSTTRVAIDGSEFVRAVPLPNDSSLLRRELERLGAHLPDAVRIPAEGPPRIPELSARLVRAEKPVFHGTPKVPEGLAADRSIRMSGDDHSVELVFGTMKSRGNSLIERMKTDGWASASMGGESGSALRMFHATREKETLVVFLDEAKGKFLLVRKLPR